MALIVQKYGGTSVGDVERIKNVARRCVEAQKRGNDVVVVVSAMSGETNRLLKLVSQVTSKPNEREQDVVVATGEQVSIGLVALAIQAQKAKAQSFLGSQCRIVTDSTFSKARIKSIDAERIFAALKKKHIAVIAGFQGVDDEGNVTTLGRGGSDTTAVAIAAAIKADACEIYTDVDGVYTTDPNVCPAARKLDRVSYEEMLELASLGAKVLQIRSVEFAMKYKVPLWVKSSFTDDPGTLVCEEDASMENLMVSGIAFDKNEAKIAIRGVPDVPGIAARVFGGLDEKAIVVDLIVQNVSKDGKTDLTFTVGKADFTKAKEVVKKTAKAIGAKGVDTDDQIAKVSIVGVGMRNHSGVAAKMFQVLAREGINVQMISTSEIKVSCVIHAKYTELAVRALHTAFGLDQGGMKLSRTGWLAVVVAAAVCLGLVARLSWPSGAPALDCLSSDVRFDGGVAFCAPGAPAGHGPVGPALTLGVKLDLNRASAEELAVVPGIGPSLSQAIVRARGERGGAFRSWDEVDDVAGVGPAKLEALQASAEDPVRLENCYKGGRC